MIVSVNGEDWVVRFHHLGYDPEHPEKREGRFTSVEIHHPKQRDDVWFDGQAKAPPQFDELRGRYVLGRRRLTADGAVGWARCVPPDNFGKEAGRKHALASALAVLFPGGRSFSKTTASVSAAGISPKEIRRAFWVAYRNRPRGGGLTASA